MILKNLQTVHHCALTRITEFFQPTVRQEKDDVDSPYYRYMNDSWYFGILLTSGKILVFDTILNVFPEYLEVSVYPDVIAKNTAVTYGYNPDQCMGCICSRTRVLVRKEHILMIFEMADT